MNINAISDAKLFATKFILMIAYRCSYFMNFIIFFHIILSHFTLSDGTVGYFIAICSF